MFFLFDPVLHKLVLIFFQIDILSCGISHRSHSNILAEASINHWIWSVTPENWEKVKANKVWGSKAAPERIQKYVQVGDQIIFYVKGTKTFKGIMQVSESWNDDSSNLRWTDEIKNQEVIYNSYVKLKQKCLGSASSATSPPIPTSFNASPSN